MKLPVFRTAHQYVHGIGLRFIALLAKFAFLMLIVPMLPDQVYAQYLFLFTMALIVARVLSLGAEEHLPIMVGRDQGLAESYMPLFVISSVAAVVAAGAHIATGEIYLIIAAVVAQLAAGWVLGGLVRSHAPHVFERLLNLPVVIFVAACFVWPPTSLSQLFLYYFATGLLVQLAIAANAGAFRRGRFDRMTTAIPALLNSLLPGLAKTTSNILVVMNSRAPVVLPGLMLGVVVSDATALAVSIAEAVWQIGMVISMRNYAAYCRGEAGLRRMKITCAASFTALVLLAIPLLLIPLPISIPKIDGPMIGWALILMGALLVLMEARYYVWAQRKGTVEVLAIQAALIAGDAAIVWLLDQHQWLPAMALFNAFCAMLFMVLAAVFYRNQGHETP
ncbi:MAG: hypothetical protein KDJ37_14830 [Hyphomicrobiaceae bacterium]|nr:hypothetical protein [Hyphomicrobiaceae bacterium]